MARFSLKAMVTEYQTASRNGFDLRHLRNNCPQGTGWAARFHVLTFLPLGPYNANPNYPPPPRPRVARGWTTAGFPCNLWLFFSKILRDDVRGNRQFGSPQAASGV